MEAITIGEAARLVLFDFLADLPSDEARKNYVITARGEGKMTKADADDWFQIFDLHEA